MHFSQRQIKVHPSPIFDQALSSASGRFGKSIGCAWAMVMFLTLLPFFEHTVVAQDAKEKSKQLSPIRYVVDCKDTRNHYLTIVAEIPVNDDETELMMATWTPGSYLIREYARHIDSMKMTADGKPVEFEKTRKNRWAVQTSGLKSIKVSYRLYCNEMSVRTNWVGKQYAMINGAPTFMTVPDRLDQKHVVRLKLPKNWSRSATSLQTMNTPHTYFAENFDELVDSPIVAGNVSVYPFSVGGVPHQLVNIGESGYWNGSKAASDLKKVVKAHHKMWKVVPYDRYLFLNMIAESGGGLEHDNSTLMITSRWSYRDKSRYEGWLSLASHEFFHTWNVRRLRPKSLVEYDYENEVYTPSLWIAEGITSYYEDLLLVRSGLLSETSYLAQLSRNVESVQRTSGRKKQSLYDSSFDTWIKFYRPDENSSNTRISYYSKGAVAAFLLDAKLRKMSKGKKNLDMVMRKMFTEFSVSGYTTEDFRKTVNEVAGEDLSDWFASAIDSTDELDYSDVEFLGIEVPSSDKKTDDKKEDSGEKGNPKKKKPAEPKPWLGVSTSDESGKIKVSRVTPDSPATKAGLIVDDELIAVNGFRLTSKIDIRLKQYKVGEEIELLISRRGKLMTLEVEIGKQKSENWKLKFASKPSESQKKQRAKWLGSRKKK